MTTVLIILGIVIAIPLCLFIWGYATMMTSGH